LTRCTIGVDTPLVKNNERGTTMKAYHFLSGEMTGGYGNEPPWTIGEKRRVTGKLVLCQWGYHYGKTPHDALQYAHGDVFCEVEVSKIGPKDDAKGCSRTRKLLRCVDASKVLHAVACDIAEDVLPLFESQYPNDMRPRQAIEAKRGWLSGKVPYEDLDAAAEAATEAATVAATVAAWAAAWAAANVAARDAAWAAANAAATGAATGAAWDAAGAKYNQWIDNALLNAVKGA
jgi:hypothetical protein